MRMYYNGGNAVDAGVATMLAASVAEFSHFGLGGEAPILIRTQDGKVHAIAGVGTMPKLATADFFRKRKLQPGEITVAAREGRTERAWFRWPASCRRWCRAWWMPPGRAARVRHQIVRRSRRSRPSNWPTACAIDEMRASAIERSRRVLRPLAVLEDASSCPSGRTPRAGRDLPPAGPGAHPALDGGGREESAGRRRHPRQAAIDAVRDYLLSRRYRPPDRRLQPRPTAACCATKTWPRSSLQPEEPVSTTFHGYDGLQARLLEPGPGA